MIMLLSFYVHLLVLAWLIGDMTVMNFVDLAGRWLLIFKFISLAMPPIETIEKRFGPDSTWTKNYRLIGDLIKYIGNLDFRAKMIEFYPAYRELSAQKQMEKAKQTLSSSGVFPMPPGTGQGG